MRMLVPQAPIIIRHLEDFVGRMFVRILSLTCMVVLILHLFSCAQLCAST